MASAVAINKISKESQQRLVRYLINIKSRFTLTYQVRRKLEEADRLYYRESDRTVENINARIANKVGDSTKLQNIEIPLAKEQVDSATAFLTEVFCSSNPLFPVVGPPKYADAVLMFNSILEKQARKGRWKAELIKFFRDCNKYDIGACEIVWSRTNTAAIDTDIKFSAKEGKPRNIVYEGNSIKRLDLYNTFWDTTLAPHLVASHGEYVGYDELVSRSYLKQYIAALGDDVVIPNIAEAFNSPTPLNQFYVPQINPDSLTALQTATKGINWFNWMGINASEHVQAHKGLYVLSTLYARIIPSDFDIRAPAPNTPQVWKFVVVNYTTIIYIERQTNAHELIPVVFGSPNDDGLIYQTKSLLDDMKPFQHASSTIFNGVLASRRREVNDKGLFNPLYVEERHINNPNPAAKIPIKPAAYNGVPLNEIYMPIPFQNTASATSLQEINIISSMADMVGGQNKAQRGQFVKGNKTQTEFSAIMAAADSKPKARAIVLEDQVFGPAKYIIATNILQYQGADSLYHKDSESVITVDPLILRNAILEFKITDGVIPAESEINAEAWQTALQMFATSPDIAGEYNKGEVFSYLLKMKGADIHEFKKSKAQIAYEQALAAWQNAIAVIMKANPQATQQQLPPQPKPADYGIGPDGAPIDNEEEQEAKKSLIEQIMSTDTQQQNGESL